MYNLAHTSYWAKKHSCITENSPWEKGKKGNLICYRDGAIRRDMISEIAPADGIASRTRRHKLPRFTPDRARPARPRVAPDRPVRLESRRLGPPPHREYSRLDQGLLVKASVSLLGFGARPLPTSWLYL
ncbi:hypothetical protein Taro_027202 [Colocasia esculenta]|uniref:Uncharacterized protein n=1 Tax=Colocasia esculenta TaxID=4460 RepID=A0A843VLU4_COLES|nr:hypothetical protein [Colocasia esculenta]